MQRMKIDAKKQMEITKNPHKSTEQVRIPMVGFSPPYPPYLEIQSEDR